MFCRIWTVHEAGSFLLEFGMLSVLSGQPRFYHAAKRSLLAFWSTLARKLRIYFIHLVDVGVLSERSAFRRDCIFGIQLDGTVQIFKTETTESWRCLPQNPNDSDADGCSSTHTQTPRIDPRQIINKGHESSHGWGRRNALDLVGTSIDVPWSFWSVWDGEKVCVCVCVIFFCTPIMGLARCNF